MHLNTLYAFWAILKRDTINIVLNPVLLLTNTIFPLLLILALSYLTGDHYGGNGVSAYDYYGITILIFVVLNVSITAANSFMEKSLKTSNLRITYTPIPTSFVYLSKITATFLFTSGCLLVLMLFLHAVLAVNFGRENTPYVILLLVMFNFFSASVGVCFCCLLKSEEVSNQILSIANNLFALLGGLFFSLDGFGKTMEMISYMSPVKWVAEGLFRIIYDLDFSFFAPTVTILLLGSLLLLLGCKLTFKVEDYV